MSKRKANLDDGCSPELVAGAEFDGILEIPMIKPPDEIVIPSGITPFTKREHAVGMEARGCAGSVKEVTPVNKIDTHSVPGTGTPNSVTQNFHNGVLSSERYYDDDGNMHRGKDKGIQKWPEKNF